MQFVQDMLCGSTGDGSTGDGSTGDDSSGDDVRLKTVVTETIEDVLISAENKSLAQVSQWSLLWCLKNAVTGQANFLQQNFQPPPITGYSYMISHLCQ